jgi:hypothetical protein
MVELTARRRMSAGLTAERVAMAAGSDRDVLRWSREFFERLHATLLPCTAPVAQLPEGELRYLGARDMSLWAFVSPLATALALDHADTEVQIRERARRWLACLTSRTAPGLPGPHWGHPVYGARLDPGTGELDVVWAVPGAWCDAVLEERIPEREWDTPQAWARELASVGG